MVACGQGGDLCTSPVPQGLSLTPWLPSAPSHPAQTSQKGFDSQRRRKVLSVLRTGLYCSPSSQTFSSSLADAMTLNHALNHLPPLGAARDGLPHWGTQIYRKLHKFCIRPASAGCLIQALGANWQSGSGWRTSHPSWQMEGGTATDIHSGALCTSS